MSKDAFHASLRAAARGLWLGALSAYEFPDAFGASLDRYLREAFDEGMAYYGIEPEDYTDEDIKVFQDFLMNQYSYLPGLTDFIVSQGKVFGGSLESVLVRVEMWVNRYDEIRDIARARAGADEKQEWQGTPGKQHCETCYGLIGWVKRGSYWQRFYDETGIRPKAVGGALI